MSFAITSAIPPVFEAYATLELPGSGDRRFLSEPPLENPDSHTAGVLAVLSAHSAGQLWWIGYLETGGSDIAVWGRAEGETGPNRRRSVRAGRGRPGAGRCLARAPALEGSSTGSDVSGRSLVARIHFVGLRLIGKQCVRLD